MPAFIPLLVTHDQYLLECRLQIHDWPDDVVTIRVRDRFGIPVYEAATGQIAKVTDIDLGKMARARFPLFAIGLDNSGAEVSHFSSGPIFYSPADTEYSEGFSLPRPAVDVLNDKTIRRWQAEALAAKNRHAAALANVTSHYERRERLTRLLTVPLLSTVMCAVGTSVLAGLATNEWRLLPLAIGTLLFMGLSLILLLRIRRDANNSFSAAQQVVSASADLAGLEAKLYAAGAAPLEAKPGCGCKNK